MPLFILTPALMFLFALSCVTCTFTIVHNATSPYTFDRITTLHRVWGYTNLIILSFFTYAECTPAL